MAHQLLINERDLSRSWRYIICSAGVECCAFWWFETKIVAV
jgi:hypothetical protein